MAECPEFPGRGKVVLVRRAGLRWGLSFRGAISGRICGKYGALFCICPPGKGIDCDHGSRLGRRFGEIKRI